MTRPNLGASRFRMFVEITLPLSLPGILAGCMLVFTLAASAYATPALVGGSRISMLASRSIISRSLAGVGRRGGGRDRAVLPDRKVGVR